MTSVQKHEENHKIDSFEDILNLCGTNGWKNYSIFFMASICTLISPLHLFSYQFLGDTPLQYRCDVPELQGRNWTDQQIYNIAIPDSIENGERVFSKCSMYQLDFSFFGNLTYDEIEDFMTEEIREKMKVVSCDRRAFKGNIDSVVTHWDLVCERRVLYSTTQSASQIGTFFASILLGYLMDKCGRSVIYKMSAMCYIVSGCITCFSFSIEMYITMKAISSFFDTGTYMSGFVLVMEMASLEQRSMVGNYFVLPWCFGIMLTVGICWMIRPWRYLQAALTAPAFILLLAFWLLPESPRWLILNKDYEGAFKIMQVIGKANRKDLVSKKILIEKMICIKEKNTQDEAKQNSLYFSFLQKNFHLLKTLTAIIIHPTMRRRTAVVFWMWLTTSMVYYGVSLGQSTLSTDPYLYILIGAFLELLGYLMLWPLVNWLGSKKSITLLLFSCGISIISVMILNIYSQKEEFQLVKTILFLVGKFAISPAFQLAWFYTAELYPTNLRSLAIGEASTFGRIGSAASPYINDLLGTTISWAPAALFGVLSLCSGFSILFLPETSGENLPDSLHSDRKDELQNKNCQNSIGSAVTNHAFKYDDDDTRF